MSNVADLIQGAHR